MGYKLKSSILLSDLAALCGLEWGGTDILIEGVSTLSDVGPSEVTFSIDDHGVPAGTVLVTSGVLSRCEDGLKLNPIDFITLLNWLNDEIGFDTWNRESRVASSVSWENG